MLVWVVVLVCGFGSGVHGKFVSALGDPGMLQPPRFLLEGWNMCNRAGGGGGEFGTCGIAPRWADCAYEGGNWVTEADNAAGLGVNASEMLCDPFTQEKERKLGGLCASGGEGGSFWTTMLKSGNYLFPAACCKLCGLWCAPSCCPNASTLTSGSLDFNNLPMNQPIVHHQWSHKNAQGLWQGGFNGTWDIAEERRMELGNEETGCGNLSGVWIGTVKSAPISVVEGDGGKFVATCSAWGSARNGWVDANGTVALERSPGDVLYGTVTQHNATSPPCSQINWETEGPWCKSPTCPAPPPQPPSYFETSWTQQAPHTSLIFTNKLRTSTTYPWLMLYFGADAAEGRKGGYPWDGRGMMVREPRSSPRWNDSANEFNVTFTLEIKSMQETSSFYFLNTASCWKENGTLCDGDIRSDVTVYILLDLNAGKTKEPRCSQTSLHLCPPTHTFFNGTSIPNTHPSFPYSAYVRVSTTPTASYSSLPFLSSSLPSSPAGFDPWSNPQAQRFYKIAPDPEWAVYGFPASREEVLEGKKTWNLNVGAWTSRCAAGGGPEPPYRPWTTLNIGPEMGLGGEASILAEWTVSDFDVLVQV